MASRSIDRRPWSRARAGLLAVVPVVVLALAACGGNGDGPGEAADRRADQARGLADDAGLDDDVQDLLALAASVVDETYVVTYELGGADAGTVVTVTSSPPARRVDVTALEAGSERPVTRSVFSREDGTWSCRRGARRWFCARAGEEPAALAGFAETDVERTVDALRDSVDDAVLTVVRRTVVGVEARCLVSRPRAGRGGATAMLCISPEGVPLLVERPAGSLRATAYTTEVADDAFELPAEPD